METFHIAVAMKPLEGNFSDTVLQFNTGGLNIDSTRIPIDPEVDAGQMRKSVRNERGDEEDGWGMGASGIFQIVRPDGRFPSNVILDGSKGIVRQFPEAKAGGSLSGNEPSRLTKSCYGKFEGRQMFDGYGDEGNASRFFYTLEQLPRVISASPQFEQMELDI